MKKMYKKPIVEQAEMMPQSIICVSAEFGGTTQQTPVPGADPIPGN